MPRWIDALTKRSKICWKAKSDLKNKRKNTEKKKKKIRVMMLTQNDVALKGLQLHSFSGNVCAWLALNGETSDFSHYLCGH